MGSLGLSFNKLSSICDEHNPRSRHVLLCILSPVHLKLCSTGLVALIGRAFSGFISTLVGNRRGRVVVTFDCRSIDGVYCYDMYT